MGSIDQISSAQLEQYLLQNTTVSQARILNLSTDDNQPQWVVALALTKTNGSEQPNNVVVKHLRETLLEKFDGLESVAVVPKKWILLPRLPIASSGNIDDSELIQHLMSLDSNYVNLSMQDKLRLILSKVLRKPVADIPPSASFIRQGGDSITAIEFMSRCLEQKIQVSVRDLMNCETLAELALLATFVSENSSVIDQANRRVSEDTERLYLECLAYWDLSGQPPQSMELTTHRFDVPQETVELFLEGSPLASKMAPMEILVGAILDSFQRVFSGRSTLAAIVTCTRPVENLLINFPLAQNDDFKGTMRRAKDSFALARASQEVLNFDDLFAELVINYNDQRCLNGQNNGYANGKLNHNEDSFNDDNTTLFKHSSASHTPKRIPLFEINITVSDRNCLAVELDYMRKLKRGTDILRWMDTLGEVLEISIPSLAQSGPIYSLSDFPRLPLSYSNINSFLKSIREFGFKDIEAVYPTSAVQDGILLSQIRTPGLYRIDRIFKVYRRGESQCNLTLDRFEKAWNGVVAHNSVLRTVFVTSVRDNGPFDQIVLRNVRPDIKHLRSYANGRMATDALRALEPATFLNERPAHRLSICSVPGGHIYCKLEISHAIVDGMSGEMLFKQICQAYDRWPPNTKTVMFGDYISFLQTQSKAKSLEFWQNTLHGTQPCLFPSLVSRISEPETMKKIPIDIGSIDFKSFCMARGITAAMLLQAVWAVVLRGYSLMDDVCFGYLASGRDVPMAGITKLIGPLINLLICRVRFDQLETFEDLLFDLRDQLRHAMDNQYSSLAEIQHTIAPGHRQLFNTLVSMLYSEPEQPVSENELDADIIDDRAPTEYAVTLIIQAKASQLNVSLNYFTSIMSDERAVSLAASFIKILNKILVDPTSLISEVPVISDLDMNRICADQSQLVAVESCAHWEIDKQIQLLPEEPAIVSWDRNLTYAELGDYARRLAMKLQELGVGPEVLVPLCFPKSTFAVVAMVAIAMAGGGFVPLDPSAPRLRLKSILQDTKATLAIVAPSCEEILRDMGVEIYAVDEPTISALPAPVTALTSLARPRDVAFAIFTSGSTGEPKGMIHQHNGICSTAASYGGTALHIGPGTRVFQFSAYTFDIGILDVLVTLMRGGCICIPSEYMRVNDLIGAFNTTGANWAFLTPSVADLLSPAEVPYLKTLALGGEAIPTNLAKKWKDAVELHGVYGPAEASCCAWNPKLGKSGKSTNIGQALYSNFWIVNPGNPRQLVPDGCIGELLIQGPMLARGYINVNSKAAANWLEDVDWLPRTKLSRAYLTGDIVCRNDDGSFEFKGRRDNQVKLHGQRVELGEIEIKLQEVLPQNTSGIIDMLTTEHSEAGSLLAYLWFLTEPSSERDSFQLVQIVTKEMQDTISNIHSSLSLELPAYMIPAAYLIFTGAIEKTTSGKIDRRQLARLAQGLSIKKRMKFSPGAAISEPPTTEMEFKLRDIWSQVLKVDTEWIGKNDRFLQIGGDSMTAIKLVTLARQQGINLTIAQIFQDSRLSYLAATASGAEDVPEYEIEPFGLLQEGESNILKSYIRNVCQLSSEQVIEDVYPSTSLQEGLMVLAIKQPGSYIAKYAYKLSDDVDLARFKAAWAQTLELCGNLRTRFVQRDGVTFQALVKEKPSWEPTEDRDLQYVMDTAKAMRMHYGLRLCRYALCRGKGGEWHFVLIMHHTIFDGWSLKLVLDILYRVYTGVEIPSLQPYSSFINYMTNIDQDESRHYWKEQLEGAQRAAFPETKHTTHMKAESRIMKTKISFPQSIESSITKATVIRAAWALVLARYCETDDVCFGITVSGRQAPLPGVERVSGPLIATVPVRVRLQGQQTVSQYLEDTQRQASEMIAHEQFGLQNISRVSADAKDACDFSNLLAIQPMEHINLSGSGDQDAILVDVDAEALGLEDVLEGYFTYPLVLQGLLYNDHVELMFIYKQDIVSDARIEALSHHLEHVLQQLLVQTEATVDSISVAGDWDLQKAIKWNSQAEITVVRECVHDMISAAGLQTPDKEAIYSSEGSLTFGELDHISTQLGIHLAQLGVGVETMVSICSEKSMWVIVAMLGVMKAGGVFVPLDPSHPTSRRLALAEEIGSQFTIVSPQTSRLEHAAGQVVELSASLMAELSRGTMTATTARALPSNAAYAIFTSGSTGTPKAIVIEHHAICTSILAHGKASGMNQDSRMLQFATYVFDTSLCEILTTLVLGGTVCVPSDAQRLQDITGFIAEAEVNVAMLTPSFASTFGPDDVPTLKTLNLAGEAPTRESLMAWCGRVRTINSYGPAEACIISASYDFQSADECPTTIGQGGMNNACWIVDPNNHQRLAPIGCIGELLFHGSSLARGYVNSPEAARQSFVKSVEWLPSPLPNDERRFYKTGDLVKYNPDGTMQYVGRRDTQIKLRGQRVELAAIEHSIRKALPGIKHVAVDVMQRESRELLAAFIDFSTLAINLEVDEDASLPQSVLRMNETLQGVLIAVLGELKDTLPGYMVPAFYLPMRRMPFQVSMKLDRKKLRELANGLSQEQLVSFSLSNQLGVGNQRLLWQDCSSDIELWIRAKWASILNIPEETISLHDNFYDLGGDSIRIVTVSKAIFDEHKVPLSLSLLNSKHTTISNMANFIGNSRSGSVAHLPVASGINLEAKISEELSQPWVAQLGGMSSNPVTTLPDQATVFLTGATGYLGTEILRQLLDNDAIASVITLVRSESASYGLQRIQETAQKTGWWQNSNKKKIEVWTGDLSKSGMGLDAMQWARLTGQSKNRSNVDLIIHNGASVNWNADYEKLRSANVDSVVDLLKAATMSLVHPKFVFISGGLKTDPKRNNAAIASYLNNSMGYIQTKFVADGVVYGVISKLPHIQNRVSIVKPGRIIGSTRNGIANVDDMIWRVVAGAAAIHAYPVEPLEHWIHITDVSSVASTILQQSFTNGGISPFVSIEGGMPAPIFWDLVNGELEIPCKPLSWDSWKEQVLASVNEVGESHPLWPVQHFLGQLGMTRTDEEKATEPTHEQWHEVVKSNLRYLINIGFIQSSIHKFGKADQKAAIHRQH
ncbi:amino acid adenylation [Trichoderma evansii]